MKHKALLSLFLFFTIGNSLINYYDSDYWGLGSGTSPFEFNYMPDPQLSGFLFWFDSSGSGGFLSGVQSLTGASHLLTRVPTNPKCGWGLFAYTGSQGDVGEYLCLSPNLIMRRGYTYTFHSTSSHRLYMKTNADLLTGSRLGTSDGVSGNGGAIVTWNVALTESRNLYWVSEQLSINGTINFTEPCDNGGIYNSAGMYNTGYCNCTNEFFGVGCSMPVCPYGNGVSVNADQGCLCNSGWGGFYCQYPVTDNGCGNFQSLGFNITLNPTNSTCDCSAKWSNSYTIPDVNPLADPFYTAAEFMMRSDFNYMGGPMASLLQARMTCYMNAVCDGIMVWNSTLSGMPYDYYFLFTMQTELIINYFLESTIADIVPTGYGVPDASSIILYQLNRNYKKSCSNEVQLYYDNNPAIISQSALPSVTGTLDLPYMYQTYNSLMTCPFVMANGSCCYIQVANYTCPNYYPTYAQLIGDPTQAWAVSVYYFSANAVALGLNATCPLAPLTRETAVCSNDCSSNPCMYGGTCVDSFFNTTCICPSGTEGYFCQTEIDECASHPCENGATCVDELNAFSCTCVPGYSGVLCQTVINECASNPFINGATCNNGINSYTCSCALGFYGINCNSGIERKYFSCIYHLFVSSSGTSISRYKILDLLR